MSPRVQSYIVSLFDYVIKTVSLSLPGDSKKVALKDIVNGDGLHWLAVLRVPTLNPHPQKNRKGTEEKGKGEKEEEKGVKETM